MSTIIACIGTVLCLYVRCHAQEPRWVELDEDVLYGFAAKLAARGKRKLPAEYRNRDVIHHFKQTYQLPEIFEVRLHAMHPSKVVRNPINTPAAFGCVILHVPHTRASLYPESATVAGCRDVMHICQCLRTIACCTMASWACMPLSRSQVECNDSGVTFPASLAAPDHKPYPRSLPAVHTKNQADSRARQDVKRTKDPGATRTQLGPDRQVSAYVLLWCTILMSCMHLQAQAGKREEILAVYELRSVHLASAICRHQGLPWTRLKTPSLVSAHAF